MAGGALAHHLQSPRGLGGPHRVTVHGRGPERRLVAIGGDVFSKDPANGLGEGDGFSRQRRDLRQHPRAGVVEWEEFHAAQSPLFPPVLETRRTPSMTIPFSAAFSMS